MGKKIDELTQTAEINNTDLFAIQHPSGSTERVSIEQMKDVFQAAGDYETTEHAEETYATKTELTSYKTKRDIITDKKWWDFNEVGSGVHTLFYLGQTDTSYKLPSPYCSITVNFLSRARGTAIATDWRNDQNAKSWICQLHDDTNQFNWGSWKELATKEIEFKEYNQDNTQYNSDYIKSFHFKTFKQNGILYITVEGFFLKQDGINIGNVITGLPHLKNNGITIQISDWQNHTGMLRYESNGSITLIWSNTIDIEISGNATAILE